MASSGHLKPGEKGGIRVSVDTRGGAGHQYKTVQVQTNIPAAPLTQLSVSLQIRVLTQDGAKQPAKDKRP